MKRYKRQVRNAGVPILILCEGKTEENYFRAIKDAEDYKKELSTLDVDIFTSKHSALEYIVKEAIQRADKAKKEGNAYAKIWIVFDHDNQANRKKAYDKALKKHYQVAFSAISFEIWYLLHFTKTTREFANGNEVIKELKKYYPDYEKARQNDFEKLKDKLEDAFSNSHWLRTQVEQKAHLTDHLIWTDVDQLIFSLINQHNNG